MGIALPQLAPASEDRVSGAQVIDGSLKFNGGYLTRTPSSNGNRRTWTYSSWIKFDKNAAQSEPLLVAGNSSSDFTQIFTYKTAASDIAISAKTGSSDKVEIASNNLLRDTGWYHIVAVFDSTGSGYQTDSTIYVNGVEISRNTNTFAGGQNYQSWVNSTAEPHYLGYLWNGNTFKGEMSQVYLIDGQALGPENFGYTDPLTNTWRPKKFSGNFTVSNPSAINDGTDWNSYFTGDYDQNHSWGTLYQSSHAFDGDLNTKAIGQANGTGLTWTAPGGAIGANATTIRIYGNDDACPDDYLKINGTNYGGLITQGFTAAWTVLKGSGAVGGGITQLESIYLRDNSAGNQHYRWAALEIDGVILVANQNDGFTGTNSFYLPMDGNSPIGEDKSGGGNNWTPVNFGGSVALDNPQVSGARPILNVTQGGTQAGVGVFGSELNQTIEVTVSNASGNNRYYFDGSLTPNLAFTRGSTITFHTTNNGNVSGDGHPFKLSSTNASGSAGTEYTDGVAYYINGSVVSGSDYVSNYSGGAASGFRGIKWTVPHNQSTTYYYCTIHTGMGNNGALTSTIDETKADPYAWKSVLALPLVGSANDVSNSVNSGSTTKTITVSGAAADSTDSNFYNGSFVFDGSNDQLSCAASADFNFGSSDFTLEAWLNMDTIGSSMAISEISGQSSASSPYGQWYFSTSTGWQWYHSSSNYAIISKDKVPTNKWFHLALVRNGNTLKHYLDGVEQASSSYTRTDAGKSDAAWIIGQQNSSSYFDGHIQDYRIYNGVAKYTSNFIPASTSPDILPDTPSGVSGGSKLTKITDGAVAFDGTGDYLSVSSSSDLTFGTGDFTVEMWVYASNLTNRGAFYDSRGSNDITGMVIGHEATTGQLKVYMNPTGGSDQIVDSTDFSSGRWYHIAVTCESTSVRLFVNGILKDTGTGRDLSTTTAANIGYKTYTSSGYDYLDGFISNFRAIKGTALYTSNFTPPTRELTNVTNTKLLCCQSNTQPGGASVAPNISGVNDGTQWSSGGGANFETANPIQDAFDGDADDYTRTDNASVTATWTAPKPIAWSSTLKIRGARDSGTNADIIVNGVDVTSQFTGNSATLETITITGVSSPLTSISLIGVSGASQPRFSAVYIDDVMLVDPLTPNGDAAATNFNPFNTDINTVRGQETGYCTLNPLFRSGTYSDGNLVQTTTSGNGHYRANFAITASSGKYYFEYQPTGGAVSGMIGLCEENHGAGSNLNGTTAYSYYGVTGYKQGSPSAVDVAYGATFTFGDVIGVAFDTDNNTLEYFKNGVSQGVAFTSFPNYPYYPAFSAGSSSNTVTYNVNFGQKPFKFPPPEGFQPLNAANVKPETVTARPDQFVGVTTYNGDDQASHIINDLNFGAVPDLVWLKKRTGSGGNQLYDQQRGATKPLQSDSVNDEDTQSTGLLSFVRDGFELGASSTINGLDGDNGNVPFKYVAWCWKAGGGKPSGGGFFKDDVEYATAAAAGITGLDGTGEMTTAKFLGCSIGTKQGFSIIKYRGLGGGDAKVPHGLSQTPDMVIVKNLDEDVDWAITHSGLPGNRSLRFTTATTSSSGFLGLNKAGLASTYFTINYSDTNLNYVNSSNDDFIAYIWHDVPGLQKFSSYTANNNADGPFVELGFKPAIIWLKPVTRTGNWTVIDVKRDTFNVTTKRLSLNLSTNETDQVGTTIDILSNGFKCRTDSGDVNNSTNTYIYCAWAEAPTFNLYGAQSNAR